MGGNAQPQFGRQGNISSGAVTVGNTSSEGGGTIGGGSPTIFLAFTADATNGSFVDLLRWMPTASSAGTATTSTVGRVFVSSVASGSTTSANTFLINELTLPSITADSASAAVTWFDVPLGFRLPAGYTILVTNHATPAGSTQWIATVFGQDY